MAMLLKPIEPIVSRPSTGYIHATLTTSAVSDALLGLDSSGAVCDTCHDFVEVRRDEFCPFDGGEILAKSLTCVQCATLFVSAGFWHTLFTSHRLRVAD